MRAGAQAAWAVSWTLRTIGASTRIFCAGCVDLTLTGDQLPQLPFFCSYDQSRFSVHVGVEGGCGMVASSSPPPSSFSFFFFNYHKPTRSLAQLRHQRLRGETVEHGEHGEQHPGPQPDRTVGGGWGV